METNEIKDFEVLSPDPADFIEDNDEVILDTFPDPAADKAADQSADQEATPDPAQPVQKKRIETFHLTDDEMINFTLIYTRLLERIVNSLFDLRYKKYMTYREFDDLFFSLKCEMRCALDDINEFKKVHDCYYIDKAIERIELQKKKFNSLFN